MRTMTSEQEEAVTVCLKMLNSVYKMMNVALENGKFEINVISLHDNLNAVIAYSGYDNAAFQDLITEATSK